MERKKPGPKPEKPLSTRIGVRLDAEMVDILTAYCQRSGQTVSQAMRTAVLCLKSKK